MTASESFCFGESNLPQASDEIVASIIGPNWETIKDWTPIINERLKPLGYAFQRAGVFSQLVPLDGRMLMIQMDTYQVLQFIHNRTAAQP